MRTPGLLLHAMHLDSTAVSSYMSCVSCNYASTKRASMPTCLRAGLPVCLRAGLPVYLLACLAYTQTHTNSLH